MVTLGRPLGQRKRTRHGLILLPKAASPRAPTFSEELEPKTLKDKSKASEGADKTGEGKYHIYPF
jgi:hypothetical protein